MEKKFIKQKYVHLFVIFCYLFITFCYLFIISLLEEIGTQWNQLKAEYIIEIFRTLYLVLLHATTYLSYIFIYCTYLHFLQPAICQNCHLSCMRRYSFLRIAREWFCNVDRVTSGVLLYLFALSTLETIL